MSKRILLLTHGTFGVNGTIGTRTFYVAQELYSQGFDVQVFARDSNYNEKLPYDVYTLPLFAVLIIKGLTFLNRYIDFQYINYLKQLILSFFFLRKLKTSSPFDIAHSWEFFPSVYRYLKDRDPVFIVQDVPIALMSILPTFLEPDEIWLKKQDITLKKYVTDCFPLVDTFLAPSKFVKTSLLNEGIYEKKIRIVPFGVDVEAFKPSLSKSSTFNVAFVGNITFRKGITYLVKAWKELELKDAKLNLYGSVYPDMKKTLAQSEKYNIMTPGYVKAKKVMSDNTIYIIPSLMEGSSKTVYEAMASGLPVIATPNSGPIFEDKKEGLIIPPKDVEAIKKAILYFYNDRKKIGLFGKRGRTKVLKFTWDHYAKGVVEVYSK